MLENEIILLLDFQGFKTMVIIQNMLICNNSITIRF